MLKHGGEALGRGARGTPAAEAGGDRRVTGLTLESENHKVVNFCLSVGPAILLLLTMTGSAQGESYHFRGAERMALAFGTHRPQQLSMWGGA